MARLTGTQRWALIWLRERELRLNEAGLQTARKLGKRGRSVYWVGAREGGPMGSTQGGLADRGLVVTRWEKGGRRLVCRLTDLGTVEADRLIRLRDEKATKEEAEREAEVEARGGHKTKVVPSNRAGVRVECSGCDWHGVGSSWEAAEALGLAHEGKGGPA